MKGKIIAGIRRGNQFSPNHVGNDAAIFSLTAEQLRKKGYTVNEYGESDLTTKNIQEDFMFNMVRDWSSICKLQQLENSGRLVINSGYGIENCTRDKMLHLFREAKIPYPRSIVINTDEDPLPELEEAGFNDCWIKRDFHAIHLEDVTYVRHTEEAQSILKEYAMRGIKKAVINEHLVGDLVKFYGVAGTDFFYWFYPSNLKHSKFGHEKINGKAHEIYFDKEYLHQLCDNASKVLNVQIYGGDCIIDESGAICLIDFNDWPSFAPCRNEAAPNIAACIQRFITG